MWNILLWFSVLLFAVQTPSSAEQAPSAEAVDRGRLSLAWDAHDSGLFREALTYLGDIPSSSPLAARAAWLRAECWYDLGEFTAAADALLSPEGNAVEGRDAFLGDIYWDQVWDATEAGQYGSALDVLDQARKVLPYNDELRALEAATEFRRRVAEDLSGQRDGSSPALLLRGGADSPGPGWVCAYPWGETQAWVPQVDAEDWLPRGIARAREVDGSLWVHIPRAALDQELEHEARRVGLKVSVRDDGAWVLARDSAHVELDAEEWRFRAAAEGLGPRGAVFFAVLQASETLRNQVALLHWVYAHRDGLELRPTESGLEVRHSVTRRHFVLDPVSWIELFRDVPEEWREFWRDLRLELGRPARAFHCFCGRPVQLREVLAADPGDLVVVAQEGRHAVVTVALCPLHLRYVDRTLLAQWGLTKAALGERAREDAFRNPWLLEFGRGEVEGVRYLFLRGNGAASLARAPELLLGALELAEGHSVRGAAVHVQAITGSTLVVVDGGVPEAVLRQAARRLLVKQAGSGGELDRLDYRVTLKLPVESRGMFQLTPVD